MGLGTKLLSLESSGLPSSNTILRDEHGERNKIITKQS